MVYVVWGVIVLGIIEVVIEGLLLMEWLVEEVQVGVSELNATVMGLLKWYCLRCYRSGYYRRGDGWDVTEGMGGVSKGD